MISEFKQHPVDYSLLGLLCVFAALGFWILSYDRLLQLVVVYVWGALYITWGYWHHHRTDELHHHSMLEYLLVAAVVMVSLTTIVLNR